MSYARWGHSDQCPDGIGSRWYVYERELQDGEPARIEREEDARNEPHEEGIRAVLWVGHWGRLGTMDALTELEARQLHQAIGEWLEELESDRARPPAEQE